MKKVLFVCVENSNRSQMAEAFAKIHGKGIVEAYSSGSRFGKGFFSGNRLEKLSKPIVQARARQGKSIRKP